MCYCEEYESNPPESLVGYSLCAHCESDPNYAHGCGLVTICESNPLESLVGYCMRAHCESDSKYAISALCCRPGCALRRWLVIDCAPIASLILTTLKSVVL